MTPATGFTAAETAVTGSRSRQQRCGTLSQRATIGELRKLSAERFEITSRDCVMGKVIMSFSPWAWFDRHHLAIVGSRGGLELEIDRGKTQGGRETLRGWRAWSAARTYLGGTNR